MTPEKTGAYIYLEQFGEYVVGDLYWLGNHCPVLKATLFRKVYKPERPTIHGICSRIEDRWEFAQSGMEVIIMGDFLYYGYDGITIGDFLHRRKYLGAANPNVLDDRGRNPVPFKDQGQT